MTTNITKRDEKIINLIFNVLSKYNVTDVSITKQDYGYDIDLSNDPNMLALIELTSIDISDHGENIHDNAVVISFNF